MTCLLSVWNGVQIVSFVLHMVQPMSLPSQNVIIFCLSKIWNGLTFLVPNYPGCPGKRRQHMTVTDKNVQSTYYIYIKQDDRLDDRLTAFDPGQPG